MTEGGPKLHFTYARPTGDDLQQGDLLRRTDDLVDVLREVHPHYAANENYRFFLVLTQSCDLIPRDGKPCRCRYISIAGVRPADLAIERELEASQSEFERRAGVCRESRRRLLVQFVERLLNNNDPAYFYLHPDPHIGLGEAHCAFLRLSVALRAYQHYGVCRQARIASLNEVFQAKLGWLVGNLYSRVGTPDWSPSVESKDDQKRRIDKIVDGTVTWIEDKKLQRAEKAAKSIGEMSSDDLVRLIETTVVPARRQIVRDAISAALTDEKLLGPAVLKPRDVEKVLAYLASYPEYKRVTDG